jgi:GT2 family glycosyltransferase
LATPEKALPWEVSQPICSVCIANYNGAGMLQDCIDSVLNQVDAGEVQIIVHDDASSDDSVAFLRERYPQVELLASDENVGFCVANNRMMESARGLFVLLLNNDAALKPDALATLTAAARSQDLPQVLTLPQYDWNTGALVDRGCLLDLFYNPIPNLDPARTEVAMAIGACLFLPRTLWNELGGFPTWMESIGEDLYLCCSARLLGYGVEALATSGYVHRRGATFSGERKDADELASTFRRRRLSERNKTAVLFICTPTPLMWLLLALHLFVLGMEGFVLACAKRDRAIWSDIYVAACRGLWRLRKQLLSSRKEMQRRRRTSALTYARAFRPVAYKLLMFMRHGLPRITR